MEQAGTEDTTMRIFKTGISKVAECHTKVINRRKRDQNIVIIKQWGKK